MKTSDHRKAIPVKVKLQVLVAQARCTVCGERLGTLESVDFDHRPALVAREFDPATNDFSPPGNAPEFIEAVHKDCHAFRTFGKRGDKKSTTRGSDVGEAARTKRIHKAQEEYRRRILARDNGEPKERSRWPKRKFPQRPKRTSAGSKTATRARSPFRRTGS